MKEKSKSLRKKGSREKRFAKIKKMEKKKNEELEKLIDKNNNGKLDDAAIIEFLGTLYGLHDWQFKDLDSSWQSSLDYIHEASSNPQLIGLVDKLFTPDVPEQASDHMDITN